MRGSSSGGLCWGVLDVVGVDGVAPIYPDLQSLPFLFSLIFWFCGYPCFFFCVFPFFSRDFRSSAEREILASFGASLLFVPKKQGLEGQGRTRASNSNILERWGISLRPCLHRPCSELPHFSWRLHSKAFFPVTGREERVPKRHPMKWLIA